MNYIKRDMENMIVSLSKEYACLLLTGPRQVGKTTLLEHLDPKRNKVTLDDAQERALAVRDPEMFLKIHKAPLLIDEVQYAPELFSYLKMQIDKGIEPGSYWLTGSQSFKLMRLAQESLAGRVAILQLSGLSQNEIYRQNEASPFTVSLESLSKLEEEKDVPDILSIYERIHQGGLPSYVSGKYTNRDVYFSSYLQTYLTRDVRDEVELKDEFAFLDFLRSVSCRIGQELNIHAIATDVSISDDTAKRWLRLLEKSNIIFYLHPYSNNLLKRVVKYPKLYFFDTGLVSYLTKHSTPEILLNSAINGAILENFVVSEIRKSYTNCGIEPLLYYYRDKDQKEIDLILEYNGMLHPIEIKKTSNPNLSMVKSFSILEKAKAKVGQGAIICMKDHLSALDTSVLIVPSWMI